ncbi:MAG TPA: alpha-glucan family phosphorylase [Desulfosalsimonadaceae bacterium]|nr:alpha-glucan family phosphorylase [Desulfosalsimonadaceae bacterium]
MNPYAQYNPQERKVAYFSMEIGLSAELPIYSGGLGVLAGDTIKSFADLGIPAVGVSLLYKKGYFHQEINEAGNQIETPVEWDPAEYMTPLPEKITITIEDRTVIIQAWVHEVKGIKGDSVPILFLDTDIEINAPEDREITGFLYGGEERYRLKQEMVLGIGGVRILQLLGHDNLEAYHMNEGHSALLTLELMDRFQQDIETVREMCVFTTHTPVPAGHDRFTRDMVRELFGESFDVDSLDHDNIIDEQGHLNMTYLALYHSEYINGVAKKHGETAQKMFPEYRIDSITNGIHARTWVADAMAKLFDRFIPSWPNDPSALRNALNIPREKIWTAHLNAKQQLLDFVNERCSLSMRPDVLTIGFARRAAAYKRADLLLADTDRLRELVDAHGPIQILYAGKAHPKDEKGKALIKAIHEKMDAIRDKIDICYLENYDMYRAKLLVGGVDVWLNTPLRPMEASGTSGMKAALNGVINLSVLDGWWLEGHIEDFTGWRIGRRNPDGADEPENSRKKDAADLFAKLENKVLPYFYENHEHWLDMMAYNIALNGSFFNTHRMVSQYVMQAYFQ